MRPHRSPPCCRSLLALVDRAPACSYFNNPFTKDGKLRGNPETPGLDLDDPELYYNTQGAGGADYWADYDLPQPTKDIRQLRRDLKDWGYALISEGLSAEQLARMQKRTGDQLEGERMAGVASWAGPPGGNQFIHGILNKDPARPPLPPSPPRPCHPHG